MEIPGFKLLQQIGDGPLATVWKAHQISLDRVVAIKILKPKFTARAGEVHPLLQEARTAAKLKHPNVIPIFDAGDLEGTFYFVMEFINGTSVATWLKVHGKPMPPKTALPIVRAVADALGHAWATSNLTHRGVNPDNILVDGSGAVKLADLGLVKAADPAYLSGPLGSGSLDGKLNYLSPEQAKCSIRIDSRTDMYGFGATLYHLVTGTMPFGGQEPKEVLSRHLAGFLPNPHDVNPSVSTGLAQVITRLMMKDYRQRYESWAEVMEDLKKKSSARIVLSKSATPAEASGEAVSTVAPARPAHAAKIAHVSRAGSTGPATPASPAEPEPGALPSWAHAALMMAMVASWLALAWIQMRLPPLPAGRSLPPPVARPAAVVAPVRVSPVQPAVATKPEATVPALPPPPSLPAPGEETPSDLESLNAIRRSVANAVCGQEFDRAMVMIEREREYEHSKEFDTQVNRMRDLVAGAIELRKGIEAALTARAGQEVTVSDRGVQRRVTVRSVADGNIVGEVYTTVGGARVGKTVTVPVSKLDVSELIRLDAARPGAPGRDLMLGVLHLRKGDYETAKPYLDRCTPLAGELKQVLEEKQGNGRGTDGSQGS